MILQMEMITRITVSQQMAYRGAKHDLPRICNVMKLYHDDVAGEVRTIIDLTYWTRQDREGLTVLVSDRHETHFAKVRRVKGYDPAAGKWLFRRAPFRRQLKGKTVRKLVDDLQGLINTDFTRNGDCKFPYHRFDRKPNANTIGTLEIPRGVEA